LEDFFDLSFGINPVSNTLFFPCVRKRTGIVFHKKKLNPRRKMSIDISKEGGMRVGSEKQ
jgi:hypothetical protein